jgi:hypothetical protein
MSKRTLQLHFAGSVTAELIETRFCPGVGMPERITVRGKTAGAYSNAGTFQFTFAVRALAILCVRAAISSTETPSSSVPVLIGFKGSIAASLDYAVSKRPMWLLDMFGSDSSDRCLASRLFHRTNPNRKRPGPVLVSLNEKGLPPANIQIIWDEKPVKEPGELRALLSKLGDSGETEVRESKLKAFIEQIAA